MSNLFYKYLPVEGTVKDGDRYFLEGSTLPRTLNTAIQREFPLSTDDEPKIKVALHLCSRDIQVGDKVHYPNKEGEFEVTVWDIPKTGGNAFKVIGEVSPEAAKYLTEDTPVTEDDVRPTLSIYKWDAEDELVEKRFAEFIKKDKTYISHKVDCWEKEGNTETIVFHVLHQPYKVKCNMGCFH
jgi:hypothetical protein